MAGMLDKTELFETVQTVAQHLADLKAQDVVALDLAGKSSVSDYFIIATVTSQTQLRGLVKSMDEYFHSVGIDCRGGARSRTQELWTLLDCDTFIVHLMTKEAREFYALEKLWFESPKTSYAEGAS